MFKRFLPQETIYFDLFEQQAKTMVEAAAVFVSLTEEKDHKSEKIDQIKRLEEHADSITRKCLETLHRTFITPFDRDEIYRLASRLDDITDEIDAAADCLLVYKIQEISPFAKDLAKVLHLSTLEVLAIVKNLNDLSDSEFFNRHCIQISHYENDADGILRSAVAYLFEFEADARMIIKWKEILEHLEKATDFCDDVANIVEGILLEYS
jgi:uncharacterized protein